MTTQIEPELPELPEPFDRLVGHYAEGAEVFTADQMRAYALSAIAADRNKRDGCDQCGSKRAVGNPLYCNACHAAFSTPPADAKASVSATGTIARELLDERNRLHEQSVMSANRIAELERELEEARKVRTAAENLIKVKGRHHTEIAYQRLIGAIDDVRQQERDASASSLRSRK